jgi:hypothetical protein
MSLNRFLIECHGLFQLALHLALIGLLEKLPRLAFILFVAFALYEKILYVHGAADEKGPQLRSQSCELLNVLRSTPAGSHSLRPCWMTFLISRKEPQEQLIRSSASS